MPSLNLVSLASLQKQLSVCSLGNCGGAHAPLTSYSPHPAMQAGSSATGKTVTSGAGPVAAILSICEGKSDAREVVAAAAGLELRVVAVESGTVE